MTSLKIINIQCKGSRQVTENRKESNRMKKKVYNVLKSSTTRYND